MYHFFVTADQVLETEIHVTGQDVNHMKNVLRMKPSEKVTISDGNNVIYLAEVDHFEEDRAVLKILERQKAESELPAKLVLFQGIPKGDKLETIVQKAVELGAYSVVPVAMKRCVAKIDPKKEEKKIARLQAISESAAKQAGRNLIPEVKNVMTLREAAAYCASFEHILLPYELADNMEETRQILSGVKPGQSAAIFIGPEGGFDRAEVEELQAAGARVVTLGKRILRTETAGMTLLSVLMFMLS